MTVTRSRVRSSASVDVHAPVPSSASMDNLPTTPLSPAPSDVDGDLIRSWTASGSPEPSSKAAPPSPFHAALLYSVANSCTSVESIIGDLAENNPHPLRNVMRDSAEYWVTNDGEVWHLKFIAKLDTTGHFTKLGPYFNLQTGGVSAD